MNTKTQLRQNILLIILLYFICSCGNTRKATYFNDVRDSTVATQLKVPETYIQKNDIISINVSSLNLEASKVFNSPNVVAGPNDSQVTGYLINSAGNLQFPLLGDVKAEGFEMCSLTHELPMTWEPAMAAG